MNPAEARSAAPTVWRGSVRTDATPVNRPPGFEMLSTNPYFTGSLPVMHIIGMPCVASTTFIRRATSSAASAGNGLYWPSPQRVFDPDILAIDVAAFDKA